MSQFVRVLSAKYWHKDCLDFMYMIKISIVCGLILFGFSGQAQDCQSDGKRHWETAGFCFSVAPGYELALADKLRLIGDFSSLETKFPHLFERIRRNGFHRIEIQAQGNELPATAASTHSKERLIIVFESYFEVFASEPLFQNLEYSIPQIALLHELLHAFDFDNSLVSNNPVVFGWAPVEYGPATGYLTKDIPGVVNLWASAEDVERIIIELRAQQDQLGFAKVHLAARERAKRFGYPTIYSVKNPLESFAELGAYIALDPEAADYIRADTVAWFRQHVLN